MTALSKSQNKHNRIWMESEPLAEELSKDIENGKVNPRDDVKIRGRYLADEYGWDITDARKIWCFVCSHCSIQYGQLFNFVCRDPKEPDLTCSSTLPRVCNTSTKSRTLALLLSNGQQRKVCAVRRTCVVPVSMVSVCDGVSSTCLTHGRTYDSDGCDSTYRCYPQRWWTDHPVSDSLRF